MFGVTEKLPGKQEEQFAEIAARNETLEKATKEPLGQRKRESLPENRVFEAEIRMAAGLRVVQVLSVIIGRNWRLYTTWITTRDDFTPPDD